jgi:anthranilate synthase component 2
MPMHGKQSKLKITSEDKLLADIPSGTEVMRYHSLMIDPEDVLPEELLISAITSPEEPSTKANGKEIMALHHKKLPIYGVQFHPESFATNLGEKMAENFVKIIQQNKK